ncbi:hypothetical protein SNE40_002415 [Patella caerulea]|uniref:Sulfatase N-terminal domain-containing protein n=1 Tax=Patella caerulea TaxID=87958 RepID=A0AAN8Q312_PATCE
MARTMFNIHLLTSIFDLCVLSFTFSDAKNVVLMFGDDAGIQLGAYNNPVCKTPHLDNLASRGVTFKYGYTSVSSCSPSRSALLTGLPQHQNGIYGLASGQFHFSSFDNVISLPKILSKNQIRTGIIGKYHVQPESVYTFDFMQTDATHDGNSIGRNITLMNEYFEQFISTNDSRPFFLYMAFHDTHRCNVPDVYGEFCEKFGDPSKSNGTIPDWIPDYYDPMNVALETYIPDNSIARQDLANLYTVTGRLDQGVGLFMRTLEKYNLLDDTLIIYTSDNGIPFPGAKTNLYDHGMIEPFIVSSPDSKQNWGKTSNALASTTDIVPTILDWFDVQYPNWTLFKTQVKLTGQSLLPALSNVDATGFDHVFASHNLHEVTMYYPMRVIRTKDIRLIHNLNYFAPYPMALDIFDSPTFRKLLNDTQTGQPTEWIKSLKDYYYRSEFEMFNVTSDPNELVNLAYNPKYFSIFSDLKARLNAWQNETNDIWRCEPRGVLVTDGTCVSADNIFDN